MVCMLLYPTSLCIFMKTKKYKTNDKGQVVDSSMYDDCTMSDDIRGNVDTESQGQNVDTEEMGVDCSTCQRGDIYVPNTNPKTSTPVKSQQIVIVSSKEVPVSSDESINIDVSTEMRTLVENQSPIKSLNPLG